MLPFEGAGTFFHPRQALKVITFMKGVISEGNHMVYS